MARRIVWRTVLCCALISASALAQSVYMWRDKNGVLNFSDEAPEGVQGVEKRSLEGATVSATGGAEGTGGPAADGSDAPKEVLTVVTPAPPTPERAGAPKAEGPARVILVQQKAAPTGDRSRHVTGSVKNVGGETAGRVSVVVKVTDADQGGECVTQELPVTPDDLEPGQVGKFDDYVDTPCFLGNAGIEINPAWD